MGGSIQTANIFTERARKALRNLTNDRARQLLLDAVEDPELFKELLRTPASIRLSVDCHRELMGWIPPPDGIAMCQGDVGHITDRRKHPWIKLPSLG